MNIDENQQKSMQINDKNMKIDENIKINAT